VHKIHGNENGWTNDTLSGMICPNAPGEAVKPVLIYNYPNETIQSRK
jgi:hypothetical protein